MKPRSRRAIVTAAFLFVMVAAALVPLPPSVVSRFEQETLSAQAGPPTDASADAYQDLTVSSTAVGFTIPAGTNIRAAYVTIETANIRYRYEGGTPTASSGHQAASGTGFWVLGTDNVRRFKAIAVSGDATARITLH